MVLPGERISSRSTTKVGEGWTEMTGYEDKRPSVSPSQQEVSIRTRPSLKSPTLASHQQRLTAALCHLATYALILRLFDREVSDAKVTGAWVCVQARDP